jgi:hypothetical protein
MDQGRAVSEPSEELVGGSIGGKFYLFGGLGPGWIPQGLEYEYDPATNKWVKKKPMALPAHHVAFTELIRGRWGTPGCVSDGSVSRVRGVRSGAGTPDDMSLMVGDLMSRHDIDWLPVVESKDDRRLIGVVRSEKMLRWLVEQSQPNPFGF